MSEAAIIEIGRHALQVALLVALPLLLTSLVIGITVSLLQVATSIQDVTLTFVPKILGVGVALLLGGMWILRVLLDFTRQIFAGVAGVLG